MFESVSVIDSEEVASGWPLTATSVIELWKVVSLTTSELSSLATELPSNVYGSLSSSDDTVLSIM